jgi:hypothetical protein
MSAPALPPRAGALDSYRGARRGINVEQTLVSTAVITGAHLLSRLVGRAGQSQGGHGTLGRGQHPLLDAKPSPVLDELDFISRPEAQSLPNVLGDSDLPLARYLGLGHGTSSVWLSKD